MNFVGGGKNYTPRFSYPLHFHENWELILQYSGHTVATAGDSRFEMQERDIIVIPPNTMHDTRSDVKFRDMYIQLKKCDFPTFPFVISDKDGTIARLFEMILEASIEKEDDYELITEKLSELICLYIKKASRNREVPELVNRFKILLMENLENEDFQIGPHIEATGYHPDYFRRIFKEHTGSSPLKYLTRLRMERAKELLCFAGHLQIDEVAQRCGFGDSLYFSSRFKKETGVSPSAYRKINSRPAAD